MCDLFFLCRCWCSFVLQEQRQRVRLSGSFLVVDEVRTRGFQNTRPQEVSASPFQRYNGCIGWLILILQPLQSFIELARCEKVMTTRAEFPFSWVYTFSATPRSLRIWAPVPPRETGYDPALPAQLWWPSGSSFPHRLYDSMKIWLAMHLNRPVKGQRLDNLAVFSVPWRFCSCYGFFLVFEILNFRQINSTQSYGKFRHIWLQELELEGWLCAYSADSKKDFCEVCNNAIIAKYCELKRHNW